MINKKATIFLTFTFGLTSLMWWPLTFLIHDNAPIYHHPLFFILFALGGFAPTIAPYISIKFSDNNFQDFNKSVLKWRINILYYLFCLAGVFGIHYLSIAVYGFIYQPIGSELAPQFIYLFPSLLVMIFFGGLEEFGWRGLLLPELNKKFSLSIAALVVGLIWGLWHLPLFFINGTTQYHTKFFEFLLNSVGLGFVLAWLYNKTNSILICVVFHALENAILSVGVVSPPNGRSVTAVIWLIVGVGLLSSEHLINKKKAKLNRN